MSDANQLQDAKSEVNRLRSLILINEERIRQAEQSAWQAEQDLARFEHYAVRGVGWEVEQDGVRVVRSRSSVGNGEVPVEDQDKVTRHREGEKNLLCVQIVRDSIVE